MTKANDTPVPVASYFDDVPYGSLTDVPCKVPRERYHEAIELLILHWSSLARRPSAIYEIGQVSTPGISDLDFVVVFPDGKAIDWTQYQPQAFPDWVQQLMPHPPWCCTKSVWPDLPAWFPTFSLRHLWGHVLPEPKVPDECVSGCALGMLVDYLIVKVPRDFIWLAWERPLHVRSLLAMLHSLKYTLKLAEQAGFPMSTSSQEVIIEIDALRSSWFDTDPSKRLETLVHLCGKVCDVVGKLISQVDTKLIQSGDSLNNLGNSSIQGHSNLFNFVAPWAFSEVMRTASEHYSEVGHVMWANPLSFLRMLVLYIDECPRLGKYLRAQGCRTKLRWDGGEWNQGLRYHATAMEAYAEAAARLGVSRRKYIALGYSPWHSWSARRYVLRVLKGKVRLQDVIKTIVHQARRIV